MLGVTQLRLTAAKVFTEGVGELTIAVLVGFRHDCALSGPGSKAKRPMRPSGLTKSAALAIARRVCRRPNVLALGMLS